MNEQIPLLRSLRAHRDYTDQPIADEVVQDILEVGRWTGSGRNQQPWEVLVVRDRDLLQKLATGGGAAYHLATSQFSIVLVMADESRQFDAGRLAERLMLAAWTYGIGSCIAGLSPEGEAAAKTLLGIPGERDTHTILGFGYPQRQETRQPHRQRVRGVLAGLGRKPMSGFVHWGRYGTHAPTGG